MFISLRADEQLLNDIQIASSLHAMRGRQLVAWWCMLAVSKVSGEMANRTNVTGWAFVVGDSGNILQSLDHALTWTCSHCGLVVNTKLHGVHFLDAQHGFVAGEEGVVLKTDQHGSNWTLCDTGVNKSLFGIHVLNLAVVHAVGLDGLVLRTETGGKTWEPLPPVAIEVFGQRVNPTLRAVRFFDREHGIVIGSCNEWLETSGEWKLSRAKVASRISSKPSLLKSGHSPAFEHRKIPVSSQMLHNHVVCGIFQTPAAAGNRCPCQKSTRRMSLSCVTRLAAQIWISGQVEWERHAKNMRRQSGAQPTADLGLVCCGSCMQTSGSRTKTLRMVHSTMHEAARVMR